MVLKQVGYWRTTARHMIVATRPHARAPPVRTNFCLQNGGMFVDGRVGGGTLVVSRPRSFPTTAAAALEADFGNYLDLHECWWAEWRPHNTVVTVATIAFRVHWPTPDRPVLEVVRMATARRFLGQRLGTQAFLTLMAAVWSQGCKSCFIHATHPSRPYWCRMGAVLVPPAARTALRTRCRLWDVPYTRLMWLARREMACPVFRCPECVATRRDVGTVDLRSPLRQTSVRDFVQATANVKVERAAEGGQSGGGRRGEGDGLAEWLEERGARAGRLCHTK